MIAVNKRLSYNCLGFHINFTFGCLYLLFDFLVVLFCCYIGYIFGNNKDKYIQYAGSIVYIRREEYICQYIGHSSRTGRGAGATRSSHRRPCFLAWCCRAVWLSGCLFVVCWWLVVLLFDLLYVRFVLTWLLWLVTTASNKQWRTITHKQQRNNKNRSRDHAQSFIIKTKCLIGLLK